MINFKNKSPVISIITVCLNSAEDLKKTIKNVAEQKYSKKEFIIIDGGSTDKTISVINSHKDLISYWVSEEDKGIYDAMNKGISFASGDLINFLNAGDYYYNNEILNIVADTVLSNSRVEIIYGLSENFSLMEGLRYFSGQEVNEKTLWKGMPICHQSMFFRRNLFGEMGLYDIKFKNMADYEYLLRYINSDKKKELAFIQKPLARFNLHGASDLDYLKNLEEIKKISKKYYNFNLQKEIYFFLKRVKYYALCILKGLKIHRIYRKIKYKLI